MSKTKYTILTATIFSVLSLNLMGCESKTYEANPETNSSAEKILDERVTNKKKIDSKVSQIDATTKRINKLLDMIKKVRGPQKGLDLYTPLDLIIDANKELSEKLPVNVGGRYVRTSKIYLPIESLSKDCQELDVKAYYDKYLDGSDKEKASAEPTETLTYLVSTCEDRDVYTPILTSEWRGNDLDLKLYNNSGLNIFSSLVNSDSSDDTLCSVSNDDNGILNSFTCSNLLLTISSSEHFLIKQLEFANSNPSHFSVEGQIFENDLLKANFDLALTNDGEINFNVKKLNEPEKTSEASTANEQP